MSDTLTVDTYTLPRITAGVSGEAAIASLNAPIIAAQTALNALSTRIGSLNQKSAIIRHYVPIDSTTVFTGSLVYYNNSAGHCRFQPAIAQLLGTPGDQGESIQAPCSRVEGMIISVDASGTTGTMLCGGYWQSAAAAQACLGASATSGTYYLSPTTAGKAVKDTAGHLRQAVLSYYGDGKFNLNVFYLAHDNHFHGSAQLANDWLPVSSITGVTPPTGAVWVYNGSGDPAFTNIGELTSQTTAVFYQGVLQTSEDPFVISDGYLWCKSQSQPEAKDVTVFNHYPFAYGSAVVRGVQSTADSLTVVNKNGLVQLTPNAFISGSTVQNPLAISAISDNVIGFTTVVPYIYKGPGINVERATNGAVTISSSNLVGSPIDAYSISHNGTTVISDGVFQYITFPSGRDCNFVMSSPVQQVPTGTTLKAVAWCMGKNKGASLSVNIYYIEQPTATASTSLPSAPQVSNAILDITGTAGCLCYAETASYATISKAGMLVAVVSLNNTTQNDVQVFRTGFKLSVLQSSQEQQDDPTPMTTTTAITGQLTAGYAASKYDVLYISGTQLQLCKASVEATSNKCVGVALAACTAGSALKYIMSGIVQDPSFSFSPGQPVYVGLNGTLSQSVPSTVEYIQKIGIALSTTAVQISIEPAILMADE